MKLEKAIIAFKSYYNPVSENSLLSGINATAFIVVTVAFLVSLLSVPVGQPQKIIWFVCYPIIMSPLAGTSYSSVFVKSLYVLLFIALIGIMNPFFDHRIAFYINDFPVSEGWASFISIMLRGLIAMQALLVLVILSGFRDICSSMKRLGLPHILIVQLLMLYRFISVVMEEALTMQRAVVSRGYGKKNFPLKIWTRLVGSLLIRSIDRSKRLNYAMLARGFNGEISFADSKKWTVKDSVFCIIWVMVFVCLYYLDLYHIISGPLN